MARSTSPAGPISRPSCGGMPSAVPSWVSTSDSCCAVTPISPGANGTRPDSSASSGTCTPPGTTIDSSASAAVENTTRWTRSAGAIAGGTRRNGGSHGGTSRSSVPGRNVSVAPARCSAASPDSAMVEASSASATSISG
ncbi:MAG: hypothetical protein E6J91_42175 [Deltaproteobacteria bacterium]|nr:MAG: hypothetical protein E6J91_42175 [Deltaproteobacteria bacterium]